MKTALVALRLNRLVSLSLIMLFAGICFISVRILPDCIYPYASRFDCERREVYGDLVIYLHINPYGRIDVPDATSATALADGDISPYRLPEGLEEAIRSIDGVKATMRQMIQLGDYGCRLSYFDDNTGNAVHFMQTGRYSGLDYSAIGSFYEDAKWISFPSDLESGHASILLREGTVDALEASGVHIGKGDMIEVTNTVSGNRLVFPFEGTYTPLGAHSHLEGQFGNVYGDLGFVLSGEAMAELWADNVFYKNYEEAPQSLDKVVYPGLADTSMLERTVRRMGGYNQLLIRLESGADEDKVRSEIEAVTESFNTAGSMFEFKVDSSIYNASTDSQVAQTEQNAVLNRAFAIVLLCCCLALALVGLRVLVDGEASWLRLLSLLGRSRRQLYADLVCQLAVVFFIPGLLGSVAAYASLLIGQPYEYMPQQLGVAVVCFVLCASLTFMACGFAAVSSAVRKEVKS